MNYEKKRYKIRQKISYENELDDVQKKITTDCISTVIFSLSTMVSIAFDSSFISELKMLKQLIDILKEQNIDISNYILLINDTNLKIVVLSALALFFTFATGISINGLVCDSTKKGNLNGKIEILNEELESINDYDYDYDNNNNHNEEGRSMKLQNKSNNN